MNNDVIRLACEQAAEKFHGQDGLFNAAGFSHCLMSIAGLRGGIDGKLVRAILTGRKDVKVLPGSSHYQLSWEASDDV